MQTVRVKHVATYRDGGTKEYVDKDGNKYYKDGGIFARIRGAIYDHWPVDVNSKPLQILLIPVESFSEPAQASPTDLTEEIVKQNEGLDVHTYKELYKKAVQKVGRMTDEQLITFVNS